MFLSAINDILLIPALQHEGLGAYLVVKHLANGTRSFNQFNHSKVKTV